MANPEQAEDKPVSKLETASNVSVQDGADKVYERPAVRGKNTLLLTTLVLVIIAVVLAWRYLF
jgi:hypothetical protein